MAALKNYDPDRVTVIFAGHICGGWGEGTMLTIEHNEDAYTLQMGATGAATRSKTNNYSGRATMSFQQTSASNDFFSQMMNADRLSSSGAGVGNFLVKDQQGRTIMSAREAWVQKIPSVEFARDSGNREWVLEMADIDSTIAGN